MKVYATELCQHAADSIDEAVAQRLGTCAGHLPESITVHHYMTMPSDEGNHVLATESTVHVETWLKEHNPTLLKVANDQKWTAGGAW